MNDEIDCRPEILQELRHADKIIKNALSIMTPQQKDEWARINELDGCIGEGTTRANEREAVIAKAEQMQAYADARVMEAQQWQPIETAPKDGSTILVWFRQHGAMTVCWGDLDYDHTSEYANWLVDDHKHGPYPVRGYSRGDDTHWMPLPAPPQQ